MSDEQSTPTEDATDTEAAPAEKSTTEATDLSAEVEKWKALAKKHEARSRENADKAKRLDDLEEASKSELEKFQARAEKAEKELSAALASALRAEVANAKGVPAALLSGSTEDELNASADALLSFKGATPKAPSTDGQGKVGDPIGGSKQLKRADLESMTPEAIEKARSEGRLDDVLAGRG